MRTTLTLDDDVATKLTKLSQQQKQSFRRVVNEVLRKGLASRQGERRKPRAFHVQTFRSAFRPGIDPSKLNALVDDLEVQDGLGRGAR
jgi:hypothetical protein